MPLPRFPITEDQINALVAEFYARIRQEPVLGPIFQRAIGTDRDTWARHEAHIASFWRNAIGLDRSFSGNPMQKHLANSDIQPEHFAIWLDLFAQTAKDVLPERAARSITELANRIGASLRFGLVQIRQPKDAPPILS